MGRRTFVIAARATAANRATVGLVAALAVLGTACGNPRPDVDPAAQPIVEKIAAAPETRQWTFTFKPHSGSPYVGCLSGIDEVQGVVDLDAGAIQVEPNREAPPIVVTETALLVATDTGNDRSWQEAPLIDDSSSELLEEVFGRSLAGFIANDVREPSPNMTVAAVMKVAASIQRDTESAQSGDTIKITVDPDDYRDELVSDGQQPGPDDPIPQFLVTVDDNGRVIALDVDTDSVGRGADDGGHGGGYLLLASYERPATVLVPDRSSWVSTSIGDIQYPRPGSGCVFES